MNKLWILLLFLALIPASSALKITEVMYAPIYDENYNEYIEIYNNEDVEVDITLLSICGSNLNAGYVDISGNILESASFLQSGEYAIITDGGTGSEVLENFDVKTEKLFYPDSSSICSRLSNSGKEITIEKDGEIILSFEYEGICEKGESYSDGDCVLPSPGYDTEEPLLEKAAAEKETTEEIIEEEKSEEIKNVSAEKEKDKISLTSKDEIKEENLAEESEEKIVYFSDRGNLKIYALFLFLGISILLNILLIVMLFNK